MKVKNFPIEVFHPSIQNTIREMNMYMTHNINASCGQMLTAIAYSLNNTYEVEPVKGRIIRPNLWSMYVSPSGAGKTPLMDAITKPIKKKEQEIKEEYKKQLAQFNQYTEERKKGCLTDKDQETIDQWLLDNFGCKNTPTEPQNATLIVGKYTTEGMDRVLSDKCNDGKAVLLLSDEVLSIFKSFNQYSRGSGEEDFLKYFNYGSESVIRADSAKQVYIREKNVSVIGCTQSDTIFDVITPNRISNGNAFRWLYIVEDELDVNKNAFEAMLLAQPEYDVMETYNKMIERFLLCYNTSVVRIPLTLSQDCIKYAANWLNEVKNTEYDIDIKTLMNITSKMEDYLIKIAIVLNRSRKHLDNEINNGLNTEIESAELADSIELVDMENAAKVVNYFINNTIKILNKVSDVDNKHFKTEAEKEFFDSLPITFKNTDFTGLYVNKGLGSLRTAQRKLKKLLSKEVKLITRNAKGEFYKLIA